MSETPMKWHQMSADVVCDQLHTDAATGLSRRTARAQLKKDGYNTLFDSKKPSARVSWLPILCDPSILLMLFCAALALVFSKIAVGITFFIVLLACVGISFRTVRLRFETEARIAKYRIPTARVVREGALLSISARRVVRGDILLLRAGDIVPCDCRLLSCDALRVLTLMPNGEGKPVYAEFPKNAQTVYPYASPVVAPEQENMLYGGSEILSGEARAIAVSVGTYTFIGSMRLFSVPAERTGKRNASDALRALSPYLRLWGIATLLSLLPLTVLAVLTAPSSADLIDLFLPLSVLVGCASPAFILFLMRAVSMRATVDSMRGRENRAILKSARAQSALFSMNELFAIGHSALTDGVPHFARALVGRGELVPEDSAQLALQPLCEAFFLSKMAEEGLSTTLRARGDDDTAFLSELLAASGFDLPALRVRLLKSVASDREGEREVQVQMRERAFGLRFSSDLRTFDRCVVYEDGGKACAITPQMRERVHAFASECKRRASQMLCVVRVLQDGTPVFLGAVELGEQAQAVLLSVWEELSQSDVRTTFFLTGEVGRERAYAAACRLPEPYLVKSDATVRLTPELLHTYRVFIGFSKDEIAALGTLLRAAGGHVGVFGDVASRALERMADLTVACDPTEYHRRATEEATLEAQPDDGMENSARCSQAVRRRADVLVCRAGKLGGGLFAVLQALSHSRAVQLRTYMLLAFLVSTQLSRFLFATLAACLGIGFSVGSAGLYAGGWSTVVAALWILWMPMPQNRLRRRVEFSDRRTLLSLFDRATLIPAAVSIVGTSLYAAILIWCGAISASAASAYLTVSLLLLQSLLLYRTAPVWHACKGILQVALPLMLIWLPVLVCIPLAIFLPTMHAATGLGAWSAWTLAALPLLPALYFGAKIFVRTAK
ncbi:MAG: cation-transporting P-type ATPase [Clostridia bacterium]|nr:cation-transporting P-type ATPase [Clostridia bacterium]